MVTTACMGGHGKTKSSLAVNGTMAAAGIAAAAFIPADCQAKLSGNTPVTECTHTGTLVEPVYSAMRSYTLKS